VTEAPRVSLVQQKSYDPAAVQAAIERLLEPLGGMPAFVSRGDRVILKPNLLAPRTPDQAVTTHPSVVRAVARMALDCGATVAVGDSPGLGTLQRAGTQAGYEPFMEELGIGWVEFTPVEVTVEERAIKRLTLARELIEADVVINLPKLKTHCMMLMTMAVKNLFGAVVGLQKFQWHLRAGRDRKLFGQVLYEIAQRVAPRLSIVDAIVAMDGDGPNAGQPNATGFLAAGVDFSALDAVLLDVVGIEREGFPTLEAAVAAGDEAWKQVCTAGVPPAELRPARWNTPATQSPGLPLPPVLAKIPLFRGWLRNQATARPMAHKGRCVLCGECVAVCPAQVMTLGKRGITIDDKRCIRCYCCHEICAHDAIRLRRGLLSRLFGSASKA